MSQFEQHTPGKRPDEPSEALWRKAFEEASEMPPSRVWDAIERRLDEEDERGIIPLWGAVAGAGSSAGASGLAVVRPWVRWSAAAAAAVVALTIGWWSLQTPVTKPEAIASLRPSANQLSSKSKPGERTNKQFDNASLPTDRTASLAKNAAADQSFSTDKTANPLLANKLARQPQVAMAKAKSGPEYRIEKGDVLADLAAEKTMQTITDRPKGSELAVNADRGNGNGPVALMAQPGMAASGQVAVSEGSVAPEAVAVLSIEPLTSRPMRVSMYGTQRMVWFRPALEPIEIQTNQPVDKRQLWASASVMPSSFNPAVSLQSAAPAGLSFANSATKNNSVSARQVINSQANLSVAYQLATGMELGKHWTLETGVGYLEANSTVTSPTQTILAALPSAMASELRTSNLYADVLRNTASSVSNDKYTQASPGTGSFVSNSNLYDNNRSQKLSNNYQFVQIPVQVGYQLRPRKRLGVAMLGGLLTNWFMRNKVDESVTITSSDGIYRTVTLAATTGLRFRYRPTQRWSASLAGVYQHALQNGTRATIDVQTRPQTVGMSMGVDYHF